MKFVEYGSVKGKTVIYFHGAPGAPDECSIFDQYAKEYDLNILCFDRFTADTSLRGDTYYQYLADIIRDKIGDNQIDIIGFSIGCHVAIETSLLLGDKVANLHLISAAAPLDAGEFLDDMAGKMVFSLAMKAPRIFTALSYWQALLAMLSPKILFRMLFASAAGKDKELSKNTKFENYVTPVLTACFASNVKGYIRDVNQYIRPWKESVANCKSTTHIWHGASDNWSPVSMARYLEETISGSTSVEIMEELSHYSCLYEAAPKICCLLAKAQ